jgi:hypothetical protein
MNEFELTKRALEGPATDPALRERARGRLLRAIEEEERPRNRRRPRVRLLAAAAAFAVVVVLVAALVVVSPFGAGPAAAELRRLGVLASSSQALEPTEGQYVLARAQELRTEGLVLLPTNVEMRVLSSLTMETWIAPDGSGFRRTSWISSDFATTADREAWEAAGRPDILPKAGDVEVNRFGPDDAPWVDVSALPTNPDELITALREEAAVPTDDQAFAVIGSVLSQGDATPELRAALLEVAARLDGVQLIGDVTDPLGRAGVALAADGIERTQLVFDPETSYLLATETYQINGDGSIDPNATWAAYEPATVVDSGPRGSS